MVALMAPAAFAQQSGSSEQDVTLLGHGRRIDAVRPRHLPGLLRLQQVDPDLEGEERHRRGGAGVQEHRVGHDLGLRPHRHRRQAQLQRPAVGSPGEGGAGRARARTASPPARSPRSPTARTASLVPTGEGVREPRNRRVEIVVPQAAPPAPVAQAPVAEPMPQPAPAPEPTAQKAGAFGIAVSPPLRPQLQGDGRGCRRRPRRWRARLQRPARLPRRLHGEAGHLLQPQRRRQRRRRAQCAQLRHPPQPLLPPADLQHQCRRDLRLRGADRVRRRSRDRAQPQPARRLHLEAQDRLRLSVPQSRDSTTASSGVGWDLGINF